MSTTILRLLGVSTAAMIALTANPALAHHRHHHHWHHWHHHHHRWHPNDHCTPGTPGCHQGQHPPVNGPTR